MLRVGQINSIYDSLWSKSVSNFTKYKFTQLKDTDAAAAIAVHVLYDKKKSHSFQPRHYDVLESERLKHLSIHKHRCKLTWSSFYFSIAFGLY